MSSSHEKFSTDASLTCPRCQRQHQLVRANLLAGGVFRCPCGWTMRVVSHQREAAPQFKPAY